MNKILRMLLCLGICGILLMNDVYVGATDSSPWLSYSIGSNSTMPVVVSLGDSYSAGEGIQPYYGQDSGDEMPSEDWVAHRSELAWPGLLEINGVVLNSIKVDSDASTSDLENGAWYFAAVSGATCENIVSLNGNDTDRQQKSYIYYDGYYYGYTFDYQINTITSMINPDEIDYVTLTIGGNDAGFTDILTGAVTESEFINMSSGGIQESILQVINNFWESSGLGEKLKNTYIEIMKAAPSATLIVAGYPQLINSESVKIKKIDYSQDSPEDEGSLSISYGEACLINNAVVIFDSYISQIVDELQTSGYSIEFVDVYDAFKGHEAYTTDGEAYIEGLTLKGATENIDYLYSIENTLASIGTDDFFNNVADLVSSASFHPNEAGAQAYASAVQEVINELEEEKENQQTEVSSIDKGDANTYYEQALELLESLDSFSMDINIEMLINVRQGTTSAKATTVFDASCQLENYGEDDFSMIGSVTLTGGGLDYAYDMSYENGVAYYNYSKPSETSASYAMSFDLMAFETLDSSAITSAEIVSSDGDEIILELIVDGDAALENGAQLYPELMQQSNVSCGDIEMTVVIDADTGYLKSVIMYYNTSMSISGYSATAENTAVYTFTIIDTANKESDIPDDALAWNGHHYYIFKNECTTWEDAKEYCESFGGYLAVISSEEENMLLFQYMLDCGYEATYFGYTDSNEEGVWEWVYDEGGTYTNWASTEPNSENSNEDYAEFYIHQYSDGSWNDGDFAHRTSNDDSAFICEWN